MGGIDTKTILLGGAGLAAVYLMTKSGSGTNTRLPAIDSGSGAKLLPASGGYGGQSVTNQNIPASSGVYNQAYYEMYQYPAMKLANPNITNPNYTLTPSEANQYVQNYQDLQDWLQTVPNKTFPTREGAIQYHWRTGGPPEKRTFLPLSPRAGDHLPAPVKNPNSSGSGGGFLGTLKKVTGVVGSLLAILGVNDTLNDEEVQVLLQGAAIMNEILPFYKQTDPKMYNLIIAKMDLLVDQYTA